MKRKYRTVNEIAKLTGITIRTLHYYDKVGLFKPSHTSQSGYRLYNDNDIEKLQQILFFKEIGFELKQIKEIIQDPNFDGKVALKKHKEILILKKKRIEDLINIVDNKLKCSSNLSFSEFDKSHIIAKQKEYHKEVLQRWGNTDAYKEYKMKRLSLNTQFSDLDNKAKEIFGAIAKCMDYPPNHKKVQKYISLWQEFITKNYYNCTKEVLQSLAQMYVEDTRFKNYINSFGNNLSAYISDAIFIYCKEGRKNL